jgi:two-component system, OmpR family, sensor histidine kinase BaeS
VTDAPGGGSAGAGGGPALGGVGGPGAGGPGAGRFGPHGPGDDPWAPVDWSDPESRRRERARWNARRAAWAERSRARGHRPPKARAAFGFFGCLVLFVVLAIGTVATLATWIAGAFLGLLAPSATPSTVTAVAVLVVMIAAVIVGVSVVARAVGPLGEIAAASRHLADGEPGVRVRPRGPRPVRSLAVSFNTMAERLDRSRADRRAMLADVTHELRTPLTIVQGGLEAMLDGIHPMDEDHVAPLLAETAVMGRLVDDLRTLSLADAGALTLHREPADLAALVREVVAAQGGIARAKGVELVAAGDARLVTSVDPVRYREIVANLVSNAVRHTPSGGRVEADVRVVGVHALLTVTDTGEGIDPEQLARVFDRFERRSDTGGSGLGLAIVRDLAEAHGGEVLAASDGPGRGATFRVRLPLEG